MSAEQIEDTAALRKARGAFFTPEEIARFISEWAVRSVSDKVLEPSCGEAAFLLAAAERLDRLTAETGQEFSGHLDGVELHAASAVSAESHVRMAGYETTIQTGDFFTVEPTSTYDAVIGNPPYVRYQDFSGESRRLSRAAALRAGVSLTALASSWASFTLHSAMFLRKGGRLGLVLPAELLSVNYAAGVRQFLMERFTRVDLVLFEERVFPGVLEEVVLLMADGFDDGGTDHCFVYQARSAADLEELLVARRWTPVNSADKWTPSLLPHAAFDAYTTLVSGDGFTDLEEWGDTTLGMVTGNNHYFALTDARVAELGIPRAELLPLSPPGSTHLRGLTFTTSAHEEMLRGGSAGWLFRPSNGEPSEAALAYIAAGDATGVSEAYKCRVRKPWWRVPLVPPADLLLTYMNADTPRLTTNRAGVHNLNSVHGIYLKTQHKTLGRDLLPLASLNSVTLLGAETVGRAYGGGMLKIEPREADRLPVPSAPTVMAAKKALSRLRPKVTRHLRSGRLLEATHLVDEVLLVGELGVRVTELREIREARAELTARRTARGIKQGGL
ncbi:methyltransferase [Intrasporangium oryzae NRRL B-24470]|uniref:Methyltransferase n=1 Tax=Intrasporangium oryzae NRRL B-24470 TaxID=1386089 RepID=W9G746_9MICO|nr:N-6 DNA methylase [Intrasporangium oryzae]EWS99698.1 methyltransferase [Intrasporangium oryzae NRRL B-24470]